MKLAYVLIVLTVLCCPLALPQTSTGKAVTTGSCSPATTGSNNTFKIECGIGKEQGDKIIKLLNATLASGDLATINAKLDELLKLASSQLPVISQQQLDEFSKQVSSIKYTVEINSNMGDADAHAFAQRLYDAFPQSSWNKTIGQVVNTGGHSILDYPYPIAMWVWRGSPTPPEAIKLHEVMEHTLGIQIPSYSTLEGAESGKVTITVISRPAKTGN